MAQPPRSKANKPDQTLAFKSAMGATVRAIGGTPELEVSFTADRPMLTTDKAFKLTKYFMPERPWKAEAHHMARSPISLVGNVTTPAMIIGGGKDYRTPISEAEQYYTALKLQRKEAVFVRFPDGSHGGGTPSQRASEITLMINWFDKQQGKKTD